MSTPARSFTWELGDGRRRTFPTYDDLAAHLADTDVVGSPEDLLSEDRDKLAAIFFEWMKYGQLGCQFAVNLASGAEGPDEVCWLSRVATPPFDRELAGQIDRFLRNEGDQAEAVALIFKGATEPEHIVKIVNSLCQLPSWSWVEIDCPGCEQQSAFALGLRWRLPESRLENWVLGFAPYELSPVTRRLVDAPFSVLAMRTLDASSNAFFPIRADGAVHLANMPLHLPCPVHVFSDKFDENTSEVKEHLLTEGELEGAARARVTLPLPEQVREDLEPSGQQGIGRKAEIWAREQLKRRLRKWQKKL